MNTSKKLTWLACYGQLTEDRLRTLKNAIGVILPNSLTNLLKECDGGVPARSEFKYYDNMYQRDMEAHIGGFLNFSNSEWSDFLEIFNNPPEFFPEGLIAFAEVGNGDLICFDYRQGKDNPDPPIVYWNHEADIGKDVSFVANNFEEFLGMLKEPED